MSFKAEVLVSGESEFASNALRFASHDEAAAYGRDLMNRWFAVKEMRVAESADAVNYVYGADGLKNIEVQA